MNDASEGQGSEIVDNNDCDDDKRNKNEEKKTRKLKPKNKKEKSPKECLTEYTPIDLQE
jgi:hypothetical protein